MATWLTHLRISERLIDKINISDHSLFFAGSIAPDTDISPAISHWCIGSDKETCDVRDFYSKYILKNITSSEFNFYLGYYVHLLTDVLWYKQKIKPLKTISKLVIENIKESWKSIDYSFILNQKEFYPIITMKDTVKYEKKWFDYYTMNQVKDLVEYITSSYKANSDETSHVDMNVKQEIEKFIEEASIDIYQKLKKAIV